MKAPYGLSAALFLAMLAIGTEYFSREVFLLLISSILGCAIIIKYKLLYSNDIKGILTIITINLGVIISKLFYFETTSAFINVLFLFQLFLFSFFTFIYFRKYSFQKSILILFSFLALPHFLGYLLNILPVIVSSFGGVQFGGFHNDPNYLSPDLLLALLSQLFILRLRFNSAIKLITFFNLIICTYLIYLTGSRTGIASAFLIIFLITYVNYVPNKRFNKKVLFIFIIILMVFGINTLVKTNSQAGFIYDRFVNSKKGGDLFENERYKVWGLSLKLINDGEYFKGYGNDQFLEKQNRFVSHNVFLDAGIKYGKYTFYAHCLIVLSSIILFIRKFAIKRYIIDFNLPTFMFIFSISQLLMMNSISVSQKHMYWFLLIVLISFGFFTPKYINFKNNNVSYFS